MATIGTFTRFARMQARACGNGGGDDFASAAARQEEINAELVETLERSLERYTPQPAPGTVTYGRRV